MGSTGEISVKEIVRNARGSHTQIEFANILSTKQSLISKYESGKANPPAFIINECIQIIHKMNNSDDINISSLEIKMRRVLSGDSQAAARKAFAIILDSISENTFG